MKKVLLSPQFLTLLVDTVVSMVLYFGAKYLAPGVFDDVKFVIAALQAIALFLIAGPSVQEYYRAKLEEKRNYAKVWTDSDEDTPTGNINRQRDV